MNDRMSKPALGRGLSHLMDGTRALPAVEECAPKPAGLSPGMATLLRRAEEAKGEVACPVLPGLPAAPAPRIWLWVRVSLVLADVLLVILAVRAVVKGDRPLGIVGLGLCALAMVMGAWLFYLAFRLGEGRD